MEKFNVLHWMIFFNKVKDLEGAFMHSVTNNENVCQSLFGELHDPVEFEVSQGQILKT